MKKEVRVCGSWLGRVVAEGPEQSVVHLIDGPMAGKELCYSAKNLSEVNPNGGITMSDDYSKMTITELVANYNAMVLTAVDLGLTKFKVVKTFHDKAAGIKRCEALNEEIQQTNKKEKKPKPEDGDGESGTPKSKRPEKAKDKRANAMLDSAKISILVDENPKRGKAKDRFALYKEGMLVSTYKEKVGSVSQALACLRWDVKHGFIKIVT